VVRTSWGQQEIKAYRVSKVIQATQERTAMIVLLLGHKDNRVSKVTLEIRASKAT
tara:strand:+ start:683 stop:847 length:165 start_codon:yes stop_codon:yes gene_type:complete